MRPKTIIKHLVARMVAGMVPPGLFRDKRYFRLWEERGYHITPVHFYEPVPDTRTLNDHIWENPSEMVGIDMNEPQQLKLLSQIADCYQSEHDNVDPITEGTTDWEALYSMIRLFKPRRMIEIGSGISTQVSAKAIQKNREESGIEATFIAIEPYPDQVLIDGFPGLSELKRMPVQNVPLAEFEQLRENDILFIDSSHILKIGSDVQYEFLEIIPRLHRGVLIHVHDVFFPYEYPRLWPMERAIFWTEAYLLQAFLAFNSAFEVLWAGSYLHHHHSSAMQQAFPRYNPQEHVPGSFWMRRIR